MDAEEPINLMAGVVDDFSPYHVKVTPCVPIDPIVLPFFPTSMNVRLVSKYAERQEDGKLKVVAYWEADA